MNIIKLQLVDNDEIMNIHKRAKLFMQKIGNCNQWINGYPCEGLVKNDILTGSSYLCTDKIDRIDGVLDKLAYSSIHNGKWLNNEPYEVLHRLAGVVGSGGIANFCLKCF